MMKVFTSENMKTAIKLNLKQMIFIFIAFFAMIFISCVFTLSIVEQEISSNAEKVLMLIDSKIALRMQQIEFYDRGMTVSVENYFNIAIKGERYEPERDKPAIRGLFMDYVRRITAQNPENTEFLYMRSIVKGEYYDIDNRDIPENYANEKWYVNAINAGGEPVLVGPYIDSRTKQRILTYSRAAYSKEKVLNDGTVLEPEFLGVVSIDINISMLNNFVLNPSFLDGCRGMIINDGSVLMHINDERLGNNFAEMGDDYAKLAVLMAGKQDTIVDKDLKSLDGDNVVAFFNRSFNGWYIGLLVPKAEYYKDIYFMLFSLSLWGIITMFFLDYFLLRVNLEKMHSDEESAGKSTFLARMSHEIRTPLNSILGMAEIILRKDIGRDVREYISIIQNSGANLLSIINDILDFSKIDAGQLKITKERYYLSSVLNDVVNTVRVRLIDKPLAFVVKADSNVPDTLIGDDVHLKQIILNILGNAVKYTYSGHVSMKVWFEFVEDGKVKLNFAIEDTGIGIKQEDTERLFMDFTRINNIASKTIEGTGLGLSIAKKLCESMDGDIFVESRYGAGSTFTFYIVQDIDRQTNMKLAEVDEAQDKRVMVFEERSIYWDALKYGFGNLGVKADYFNSFDMLLPKLESGIYEYAFVPSKYVEACANTINKLQLHTHLINMADLGEISAYKETVGLTLPAFCTNIANVLNGGSEQFASTREFESSLKKRSELGFKAPEAKILIVDDILTNLRVSKELIAFYECEIDTCLSGREAIELVKENKYDLIFMDHMMPGMDGITASNLIRSIDADNDYYNKVPIVALTANAISGQREIFLKNGMNDFLAKPIDTKRLDIVIKKWLPKEKQIAIKSSVEPQALQLKPAQKIQMQAAQAQTQRVGLIDNINSNRISNSNVLEIKQTEILKEEVKQEINQDIVIKKDVKVAIFEIRGLNAKDGIEKSGGSIDIYIEILGDFINDLKTRGAKIKELYANKNWADYTIEVHGIKGAAFSVGAMTLGETAKVLEFAAKDNNTEKIFEGTNDFLELVEIMRNDIERILKVDNDIKEDVNISGSLNELNVNDWKKLKEALQTWDTPAVNLLIANYDKQNLSAKSKDRLIEIENSVLMMEYDQAIEKAEQFINEKD